jgi:hypothetical protein
MLPTIHGAHVALCIITLPCVTDYPCLVATGPVWKRIGEAHDISPGHASQRGTQRFQWWPGSFKVVVVVTSPWPRRFLMVTKGNHRGMEWEFMIFMDIYIYLCIYLFMYTVYLFIYLCIYLFIYLCIYLFMPSGLGRINQQVTVALRLILWFGNDWDLARSRVFQCHCPCFNVVIPLEPPLVSQGSMDWIRGKFTGKPHI